MAEIVDFGLQQHKIKMDSRYFENVLSAVAGDTGRRLEVQLLDTNRMVQNTTGLNLRLNAEIAGKATFTDATLVDATTGKYQLDLSNGMFLAPGNWQFQWQITDSAGKKLHSFAFTGNIGKNISEGGSQATNFYLNLEDLKAMQDDFVNGTIESSVLETNITEKLTDLETQYAPKLTEVTAQLAQTVRYVSVESFGAIGNNITDDTNAIRLAIAECVRLRTLNFSPILYFPTAIAYKTTQNISVPKDISVIMDGMIILHAEGDFPIITIGESGMGSAYRTISKNYKVSVKRNVISNWSSEDNIGVLFINIQSSDIDIVNALRNTIGVRFSGAGSGTVYNNIKLRYLTENKIAVDLNAEKVGTSVGWVNENLFLGGQFATFSDTNLGKSRYGVRISSKDDSYYGNHNVFFKPSFELNQTSAGINSEALPLLLNGGYANEFISCRNEGNGDAFARFEGNSTFNIASVGYGSDIFIDNTGSKNNSVESISSQLKRKSTPFLSFNNLYERANYYNDTDIHISGLDVLGYYGSTTSFSKNISLSGNAISSTVPLGLYLDMSTEKSIVISRAFAEGGKGRFLFKLFDVDDQLIDGSENAVAKDLVVSEVSQSSGVSWVTSYGGALNLTSDSSAIHTLFSVSSRVKKIFIGLTGSGLVGFQLGSMSGIPVRGWNESSDEKDNGIATKPPIQGSYKVGRKIYNATPTNGGYIGWVCTVAGNPGTWKGFGLLDV